MAGLTINAEDMITAGANALLMDAASFILVLTSRHVTDQPKRELQEKFRESLTGWLKRNPLQLPVAGKKQRFIAGRISIVYTDRQECLLQLQSESGDWYTVR